MTFAQVHKKLVVEKKTEKISLELFFRSHTFVRSFSFVRWSWNFWKAKRKKDPERGIAAAIKPMGTFLKQENTSLSVCFSFIFLCLFLYVDFYFSFYFSFLVCFSFILCLSFIVCVLIFLSIFLFLSQFLFLSLS